jgi:hypothetical protein
LALKLLVFRRVFRVFVEISYAPKEKRNEKKKKKEKEKKKKEKEEYHGIEHEIQDGPILSGRGIVVVEISALSCVRVQNLDLCAS